jgi:hypothetical protein
LIIFSAVVFAFLQGFLQNMVRFAWFLDGEFVVGV